jgi:hypothetical protein
VPLGASEGLLYLQIGVTYRISFTLSNGCKITPLVMIAAASAVKQSRIFEDANTWFVALSVFIRFLMSSDLYLAMVSVIS